MGVVAIGVRFRYPTCMSSGVSQFRTIIVKIRHAYRSQLLSMCIMQAYDRPSGLYPTTTSSSPSSPAAPKTLKSIPSPNSAAHLLAAASMTAPSHPCSAAMPSTSLQSRSPRRRWRVWAREWRERERERERVLWGEGDMGSAEECSSSPSSAEAGDLDLALAFPFPFPLALALDSGFAGRCVERLRLRLSYPRLRRDLDGCLGAEESSEPWVEYSPSVPLALSEAMRRLAWRAEWRPARRRSRFTRVWWRVGWRTEWARASSRRGVGAWAGFRLLGLPPRVEGMGEEEVLELEGEERSGADTSEELELELEVGSELELE